MRLAIIVPVLEEEGEIVSALAALTPLRARGVATIVVDGGSRDRTMALAAPLADCVIATARGRAAQMNAGAAAATDCDVLLFLHADTRLPAEADRLILEGLARSGRHWGRFDVRISGRHPLLRVVAMLMNIRSRLTGVATGDQAMFVKRDLFERLGGFPVIPLMEDVALSRALKRHSRPLCLAPYAVTSGRRWEQHGVIRTILLLWRLRLAYSLGAPPARLARLYRYATPQS